MWVCSCVRTHFQLCMYRLLCVNECVFNYMCDFMLTVPSVECVPPYSVLQGSKWVSYLCPLLCDVLLHCDPCCMRKYVYTICNSIACVNRVQSVTNICSFFVSVSYVMFVIQLYSHKMFKFWNTFITLWPSGTVNNLIKFLMWMGFYSRVSWKSCINIQHRVIQMISGEY